MPVLPIVRCCCGCGRVADASGAWRAAPEHPPEGREISHGICGSCLRTLYPDAVAEIERNPGERGDARNAAHAKECADTGRKTDSMS